VSGLTLGTVLGPDGNPGTEPLALDAADLTTHGVIVGMTGSGKTGLAIDLLEEALLAGIPALVLDPKGDMGNLALTFPALDAASFRPWIDESAARREGVSPDDYAANVAAEWKAGLAAQGIGPERVAELREAAGVTIFTPGSTAGVPLDVVGSLKAPPLSWETEAETLRDEIEGTVTSLLGLVGLAADPLASREHVLVSNVVETAWRAGRDLDLGALIAEIQSPPFRKLGVFELDAFFPREARTELALRLNALVASPSFSTWGQGEQLDPQRLLYRPDGRPRAAIVYLAHLSEQERQFAVTLVLSKVVTWMRGLPGTSDLRALVYMDEVFGYAPPTAMPPSKKPILTILKQARAFGVGMVLATQNPVDLDYKAMSNAATWLVGRLQTENDKARVLEGLRSAAGGVDVAALDAAIGALGKRQFLLVSAHEPPPKVFGTRWAMSYLRGPLTKEQVGALRGAAPAERASAGAEAPPSAPVPAADETPVAPSVADGVPVLYLDPAAPWAADVGASPGGTRLRPALAVRVGLRYDDAKAGVDHAEEWEAILPLDGTAETVDVGAALQVDYDDRDFGPAAPGGASYVLPGAPIAEASFFKRAGAEVERSLVASKALEVLRNPALKLYSRPGETREQFEARCDEAAQAKADEQTAKIRDRLETRRDRLERALADAQQRQAEAQVEADARRREDVLSGAGAVLGALLGGRRRSRGIDALGRALGGGSTAAAKADARARTQYERAQDATGDLAALDQEIAAEVAEITATWDAKAAEIEPVPIRLEAADVHVVETALVWLPSA
jgi:uncharacterized protein DUF87